MTDLTTFFDRDPLSLSDTDFDEVVKGYRDLRSKFQLGDLRAGSLKAAKTPKALAGQDAKTLSDLLGGDEAFKLKI